MLERLSKSRNELSWRVHALAMIVGSAMSMPTFAATEGSGIDDWIRSHAAAMPLLPVGDEAGSPKFTVIRLNAASLVAPTGRYGGVRVICPVNRRMDLVWMFADVTNIDEYRFIPLRAGAPIREGVRQIYQPTASIENEDGGIGGHPASVLPRPWDLFQLHMLGVPASALAPGEEYLIWFRFSDRRPTDVLMAVTFTPPMEKMEAAALPPVFGLPPQPLAP